MKKLIMLVLSLVMIITAIPVMPVSAATSSTVTVSYFDSLLKTATGKKTSFVLSSDGVSGKSACTILQASRMADRAYTAKHGELNDVQSELYTYVVDNKVITGLTGSGTEGSKAIQRCFVRGLISYTSAGAYKNTRITNYKNKLTKSAAITIAKRIKGTASLVQLTEYAQVIRTTNLPKNYKSYAYILESVPNKYYEGIPAMYEYQTVTAKAPKEGDLADGYFVPKNFEKVRYANAEYVSTMADWHDSYKIIADRIALNLNTRFNVNYKTISSGNKWMKTLESTYFNYGDFRTTNITRRIADYVKFVKKNKIVIECTEVFVDPSSIYFYNSAFYIRVHAKINIKSGSISMPEHGKGMTLAALTDMDSCGAYFYKAQYGKTYDFVSDLSFDVIGGGVSYDEASIMGSDQINNVLSAKRNDYVREFKKHYGVK